MTLPHDTARCHDAVCPQRHTCLRWLHRETGWERTSHVATFRQLPTACSHHLPANEVEPA